MSNELRIETLTIPDKAMDDLLTQGTEVKESFIFFDEDSKVGAVDEWLIGVMVRVEGGREKFYHISEPEFILFEWDNDGLPVDLKWVVSAEVFKEKCPRAAHWVEVESYKW